MKMKSEKIYNPLVSIVIPVYNRENLIGRLLDVLIEQTYENIEIICVDDGSSDDSKGIIETYITKDARIILKEKANGGAVSAVCLGIKEMKGDYVCFIDSDDLVGKDYIQNFMDQMDEKYDFIAFGFYYENGVCKKPYYLKESRTYSKEQIEQYSDQVLIEYGTSEISNRFFISRWNKIYSRECIMKILPGYEKCIGVVLGEDSVFNHLLIKYSENGKTIRRPNTYFYDVGDGDSVMRDTDYVKYIQKCKKAYDVFCDVLLNDGFTDRQALYVVYYHISSIFSRLLSSNPEKFDLMYDELKRDLIYKKSVKQFIKNTKSKKQKLQLLLQIVVPTGKMYRLIRDALKQIEKQLRIRRAASRFFYENMSKKGLKKTIIDWKYQRRRLYAREELERKLPELEKRIRPILEMYSGETTDLTVSNIEKNIFIFWWDGFDEAPLIVKKCLERTRQMFSDARIVTISKYNFKEFTTIHPKLLQGFENGSISIQTFSDILRFNLLKNNGGLWVDATIYFLQPYPIFDMLKEKSYESLAFSDTSLFLQYKGITCSWSSYLQAARKGSVFVSAMDSVMENYYLKYGDYEIYFFLDAALMIGKIMGIDDNVLEKVNYCKGSAFSLSRVLDLEYDEVIMEDIMHIPQKLYWWYRPNNNENSFYNKIIRGRNAGCYYLN